MIRVCSLKKKIGQQEILRGIDLEVATGETLAIIGRSGGGKSVLLKHLVGLMEPDAGEIWIEGKNITGMNRSESTRLNSSHRCISYAVFCLKKKNNIEYIIQKT